MDVVITNIKEYPPNSIDSTIKNYHWLDFISGMFEVYVSGHEVAILVDENQKIHGGPGLNIFSLEGGVLHTPEIGVLKGVTRRYFKVFQKSSVLLLNYNLCL